MITKNRIVDSVDIVTGQFTIGIRNDPYYIRIASNYGKKRSASTCERIGKAKEKPVIQYSRCGQFLAQYESGKVAGEMTGVDARHISKVCNHLRLTAVGYRWEFA